MSKVLFFKFCIVSLPYTKTILKLIKIGLFYTSDRTNRPITSVTVLAFKFIKQLNQCKLFRLHMLFLSQSYCLVVMN
jgi:hypothetical protein